jgi:hypothetical protein
MRCRNGRKCLQLREIGPAADLTGHVGDTPAMSKREMSL